MGNRHLPGLPSKELVQPVPSVLEGEPVWQKCIEAVHQATKRLRLQQQCYIFKDILRGLLPSFRF